MSKFTPASAATKASFSANQVVEPSRSRWRISPGRTPARPSSPEPPLVLKCWKANDSPASIRLPAAAAPRSSPPKPPLPPFWAPRGSLGAVSLVSICTSPEENRNLPASP